jgi:hypothetical protein
MDPDTLLGEIRETVAAMLASPHNDVDVLEYGRDLARKVEDLDGWLSRGGFAPAAWRGAEQEDHR